MSSPEPGFAPTAPVSKDPTRCRWCRGTLRELMTPGVADYCQAGCWGQDEMPTVARCYDCEREFRTGLPLMRATLCFTCDTADRIRHQQAHAQVGTRVYNFKQTGRGDYW